MRKKRAKIHNSMSARRLKKAITSSQANSLAEVAEHIIVFAGGPKEFAKVIWDEYVKSARGSLARTRSLDVIMHMMKFQWTSRPKQQDIDSLTEEELNQEIKEIWDEQKKRRGRRLRKESQARRGEGAVGEGEAGSDPGDDQGIELSTGGPEPS